MTATDGGPATQDTRFASAGGGHGARRDKHASGAGPSQRSRPSQLRTALGVARVEASMLVRNVLVLAGLLIGGFGMLFIIHIGGSLWWSAAWQIGVGQLLLAVAVLVAAQLATGRARRNRMTDLYKSFPASAGTRSLGQLIGLAGVVPASLALIGAGVVFVELSGPIGTPSIPVLAGGLPLVLTGGAIGVAIGTRFAHPLAGVLGGLALFLSSATSHLATGAGIWLVPWQAGQDQLSSMFGPLPGYPPGGAHAAELAALAVLAAVIALALTVRGARALGGLAAAGIVAVALICLTGAIEARPIPTASLNRLIREFADPPSAQRCTTASKVRYCLYPHFGGALASLEAPVDGVLAHLPARPGQRLTVMQVASLFLPDAGLTHGHPAREVARWTKQLQVAPGNTATASAIYVPIGSWPTGGGALADAHFDVALGAAEWAVHLAPTLTAHEISHGGFAACVPVNQAREPIAIWLALLATHPSAAELQAGLNTGVTEVRNTWVATWTYPGAQIGGYISPGGTAPTTTEVGYLLAREMTRLPAGQVTRTLRASWSKWIDGRATDAQLAAALGIRLPHVPVSAPPTPPGAASQPGQQQPLCMS